MKIRIKLIDISMIIMMISTLCFYQNKITMIVTQILFFLAVLIEYFLLQWKKHTYHIVWIIVFTCWAAASSLWSINNGMYATTIRSMIQIIIIELSVSMYCSWSEENFKRFCKISFLGGTILCLRVFLSAPRYTWGTERIGEVIGYGHNILGIALSFMIIFCVLYYKVFHCSKAILLLIIPFGFIILLTGSKKSLLNIAVMIIAVMWYFGRKNSKITRLAAGLLVLLIGYEAIMNVPVLYNAIGERFEGLLNVLSNESGDKSSATRLWLWGEGIRIFKTSPIIGIGLDAFRYANRINYYAHNNYLEVGCDLGIIGLLLYYWYPIHVFFKSHKAIILDLRYSFIVVFFICLLVNDTACVSYYDDFVHIFVAGVIGYFILISGKTNSEEREKI